MVKALNDIWQSVDGAGIVGRYGAVAEQVEIVVTVSAAGSALAQVGQTVAVYGAVVITPQAPEVGRRVVEDPLSPPVGTGAEPRLARARARFP